MMKKFVIALGSVLMMAGFVHSAQAGSLDAYRPKKSGSSLTCRMDEPTSCDTSVKQKKPNAHVAKRQQTVGKRSVKYTKTTHAGNRIGHPHIRH